MNLREVAERAALTFAEAFLAIMVAAGADWVNVAVWKGAAVAGAAAVLSYVLNYVRSKNTV